MTDKSTYDQKYLDEKFTDIARLIKDLTTLIEKHIIEQGKVNQKLYDQLNDLRGADKLLEKDLKDFKEQSKENRVLVNQQLDKIEKKVEGSNPYSVKGVLFVLTIFGVAMFFFLLDGVQLIQGVL